MTRTVSAEHQAALAAGKLVARDFIWFEVKDRITDAPVFDGYWSDVGTVSAVVIDPNTGGSVVRSYAGGFGLIEVSDIPLVSDLTVQNVTVKLSQCSDRVNDLLRSYECKQGKVQIHRGHFDPETRVLASPAVVRFVGFIDKAPLTTPPAGAEGDVTLSLVSHTQELMRSNPDTRSHESQLARTAPIYDDFYVDVGVVGGWQVYWGRDNGAAVR